MTRSSKSAGDQDSAPKAQLNPNKVRIYHSVEDVTQEAESLGGLSSEEKEDLMRGELVAKDERDDDEASVAYHIEVPQALQNPQESGVFEMMVVPFGFRKVIMIHAPEQPGRKAETDRAVVVGWDGKSFAGSRAGAVWVKKQPIDDGWDEKFKGLPGPDEASVGSTYVLIDAHCRGTVPFRVSAKKGSGSELVLCVHPNTDTHYNESLRIRPTVDQYPKDTGYGAPVPDHNAPVPDHNVCPAGGLPWEALHDLNGKAWRDAEKKRCNGHHIHFTGKYGNGIHHVGAGMMVPDSFKIMKIPDVEDNRPPRAATLADVELHLTKSAAETGLHPRRIVSQNGSYGFELPDSRTDLLVTKYAIDHLVLNEGLRLKDAQDLLKMADRRPGTWQQYWVRHGQHYPVKRARVGYGVSAPPFPEEQFTFDNDLGVMSQLPVEEENPIDLMTEDSAPTMGDEDINRAQYAAQTGQKEVFDTAALASLTKTVNIDDMVDKYLSDIITGMDRIGRILFMYYWHYDAFKDRYGRQDMMDLEEALRNTFKSVGDVVLFLKQKTVMPEPVSEVADVDLSNLSPERVEV